MTCVAEAIGRLREGRLCYCTGLDWTFVRTLWDLCVWL